MLDESGFYDRGKRLGKFWEDFLDSDNPGDWTFDVGPVLSRRFEQ